ncbi:hypothetical protein D0962_18900 [Leptolyngbyaceae cyanobacterium CCMR0082]|uniref:Uncharacterized protein n=1 Tax=Adonisia turfae CCMR0082 TaxID=2304604 RepID=A0A6M0S8U0_9CYAN|nr:hypothetical protein [Adonisia turfae]NEZ64830.1 hypothetical protein [Adonisia turfae CCMR0082]
MGKIKLSRENEVALRTTLSKYQVAKFNAMNENLLIRNGVAYVSTNELHGVLLTRSRDDAKGIIRRYRNILRNFLIDADDLDQYDQSDDAGYVLPVGLYILLEQLAQDRPKRALDYRASIALLAYLVAGHPQLVMASLIQDKNLASAEQAVMTQLKKKYSRCQLSGRGFGSGKEKHIHHIEPRATAPALAAAEQNLLVVAGEVHDSYHDWITQSKGLVVSRASLRNFCRLNGYSLDWDVQRTKHA